MQANISDFSKYFSRQSYNIKRILKEFKKPIHENTFFINLDLLRKDSKFINFTESRWKMRPEVFCLDFYNEHNYYPIILLVNNISTIFEFKIENLDQRIIIAPYEETIIKVLNLA